MAVGTVKWFSPPGTVVSELSQRSISAAPVSAEAASAAGNF
jgi:hypothetical protein